MWCEFSASYVSSSQRCPQTMQLETKTRQCRVCPLYSNVFVSAAGTAAPWHFSHDNVMSIRPLASAEPPASGTDVRVGQGVDLPGRVAFCKMPRPTETALQNAIDRSNRGCGLAGEAVHRQWSGVEWLGVCSSSN